MVDGTLPSGSGRRFPWWLLLGAVLIPCLYLPTLATRFDFNDDGVLVYPAPDRTVAERVGRIWQDTLTDFHRAGPFRPVAWAHLDLAASLLGPNDFYRRLAGLVWSMLAAGSLLWLLHELKLRPGAALLATMLALWNPYRGEVWLGLSMTEAVGMPYALFGLICALRAARSSRPLGWDVAGFLALLAALCTKNSFAAIIPAQVLLRLLGGGTNLREGLRLNGWRASCHALLLLLPVSHFVVLKLNPQPGQYVPQFTWIQGPRFLSGLFGAMSLDVLAPGLLVTGLAIWLARRRSSSASTSQTERPSYRLPLLTGLVLLGSGTAIYLPMNALAGRYTMPAVWGADIWFAVLLSLLSTVPLLFWRRLAYGLLTIGLMVVAVTNLGRQEKVAARNAVLWQALECVEKEAPPHAGLAWVGTPVVGVSTPELLFSEEFHFQAHLMARGRTDIGMRKISRQEEETVTDWPLLILTGTSDSTPAGDCRLVREFQTRYWFRQRSYKCYLWKQDASAARHASLPEERGK